MIRTTFLCGLILPGVEQERMVDQVAFRQQLAIGVAGVAAQEALIDRVVNHFDPARTGCRTASPLSLLVKLETAKIRAAPFSARWVR